ncbi:MAG: c-type cytochrome [Nitrosospira sp.]
MSGIEEEGHSSAIKTPKQLITVLLAAFIFPVVIIMLLAQYVTGDPEVDQNNPAFSDEAVARRLKPVGTLMFASDSPQDAGKSVETAQAGSGGAVAPAPSADGGDKAKTIYTTSCAACHTTGAAGAPKLGDKSTWDPRIKSGMDMLYNSALKGKNAMPAKGGNASLSDADVKTVVDYMVSQAK